MSKVQRTRIIIFAKEPIAGQVKTRLEPALGERGAARLAEKMLSHTVSTVLGVLESKKNEGNLSLELCVAPDIENLFWQSYKNSNSICLSAQGEGDLGARLFRAAERANCRGEHVILIGTDCPQITTELLLCAVEALENHHAVICPTFDGGYALLGLTHCHASLFTEIPWSTDQVASITLQRLAALEFSVKKLIMLRDIDLPDDLVFLPEDWMAELQSPV